MIDWLKWAIIGVSLVLALVAYVDFRCARAPRAPVLVAAAISELGIAAQAVIAVLAVSGDDQPAEPITFFGYLLTALVIIPAAFYFRAVERTKWASVAFAVAGVTNAVLMVRLEQLWLA